MKVMTLMAAAALIAATHSIATRLVSVRRAPERVATERIFDLPTVRVYATFEAPVTPTIRPDYSIQLASRVFDLPALKVYAEPAQAAIHRPAKIRTALAVPRGSTRRGLRPTIVAREEARPYERWLTDCVSAPTFEMQVRDCDRVQRVGRIRGGVLSMSTVGHAFGQD